jgi:uncharacterized OsmC-like protein
MEVICRSTKNFQVEIDAGIHRLIADEPLELGGDDTGPTPQAMLLSALGSCAIITVEMYARRKGWPLTSVEVRLSMQKIPARECEDCTSAPDDQVSVIGLNVTFGGDLSAEQLTRLTEIAGRCPVHRTLTGEIKIRTVATGVEQK